METPQSLSVAEAQARILSQFHPLGVETIALTQAAGRVLAEPLTAAVAVPPFNNSSMDGYAVRAQDVQTASAQQPVCLPISGDIPAGSGLPAALAAGTAMRIMTGAPVPPGADAVVPVEETDDQTSRSGGPLPQQVQILKAPTLGANIRPLGQDIKVGQTVLTAGTRLAPAHIGVLAALGQAQVKVHRQPRVALFSTGNELRELSTPLAPGQIRDTNRYTLAAAIQQYGGQAHDLGIARDELPAVRAKLQAACTLEADIIISSAGVSVGAYDVVKTAVEAEGQLDFWKVRMRPGKPLVVGHVQNRPFFGLPGNPVSALLTFEVFVRPALLKLSGYAAGARLAVPATLLETFYSDGRESYLRVVVETRAGQYVARSAGDQGSAVLTAMARANGLLVIPEGVTEAPAGAVFTVWLLTTPWA